MLTQPPLPDLGLLYQINRELLDRLPNLKVVALISTGHDHVDKDLIRSYGIKLSYAPDVTNDAVAELGMTLMLSLARNLTSCEYVMCRIYYEQSG